MELNASRLARNTIFLSCLGEQIRSQKLLYNLCLVSRLFNAEFSPFLYHEVYTSGKNGLRGLLSSTHLTCIKSLSITKNMSNRVSPEQVNELVQHIVTQTPSLETFIWIDIPLATTTINALHKFCSKIKSIHVDYPEDMENIMDLRFDQEDEEEEDEEDEENEERTLYWVQDFSAFTDLEELTIENIHNDLYSWRDQLIRILKNSPNLRKLGLSLSRDTIFRDHYHDRLDAYVDFFGNICNEYAETGAFPLHLQSLKCGKAIYPDDLDSLSKLTDLAYLEEVHIENSNVGREKDDIILYLGDDDDSGIDFCAFLSPRCQNLRRFTAYQFRADVYKALCNIENVSFTRQLAISFECDMGYEEIADFLFKDDEHPFLPMQFRMIDLELERYNEHRPSTEQVLTGLVSSNSETLEGLMVHLPENPSLDGGFDHLEILQHTLQKIPSLSQLAINKTRLSLFRSMPTEDKLVYTANKLAKAVPQLQFINVCWMFWRIWRGGNSRDIIRLEELDEREKDDVELFKHSIFDF